MKIRRASSLFRVLADRTGDLKKAGALYWNFLTHAEVSKGLHVELRVPIVVPGNRRHVIPCFLKRNQIQKKQAVFNRIAFQPFLDATRTRIISRKSQLHVSIKAVN